jgi:hypothetical protein
VPGLSLSRRRRTLSTQRLLTGAARDRQAPTAMRLRCWPSTDDGAGANERRAQIALSDERPQWSTRGHAPPLRKRLARRANGARCSAQCTALHCCVQPLTLTLHNERTNRIESNRPLTASRAQQPNVDSEQRTNRPQLAVVRTADGTTNELVDK